MKNSFITIVVDWVDGDGLSREVSINNRHGKIYDRLISVIRKAEVLSKKKSQKQIDAHFSRTKEFFDRLDKHK